MAFLNGVCGRPGKAATVKIGKISNGQQIGVVNSGTETEAVLDFTLPLNNSPINIKGDKGDKGDTGEAGSIRIGLVSAGEEAAVTNRGDNQHAVLDFVLPTKGIQGDIGPRGPQGVIGPQGEKGDKGDKGDPGTIDSVSVEVGNTFEVVQSEDKQNTSLTFRFPSDTKIIKGDKGDKGDTGATGPQGLKGDQGPQGIKGDKGDTGATGKSVAFNSFTKIILSTDWNNDSTTISNSSIKANGITSIAPSSSITTEQYKAMGKAQTVCTCADGLLTIKCVGIVPTVDIPIVITTLGV